MNVDGGVVESVSGRVSNELPNNNNANSTGKYKSYWAQSIPTSRFVALVEGRALVPRCMMMLMGCGW